MSWINWIKSDRYFWTVLVVAGLIAIGLGYALSPPIFKGDRIYTPKEEKNLPTKPLESLTDQEMVYKVYVGSLNSRELALQLSEDLKKNKFSNVLTEENGLYRLQIGAYKDLENAKKVKADLEKLGYAPEMLTEKLPPAPEKKK